MDRLFVDTNFLLDLVVEERPGAAAAAQVFSLVSDGEVVAVVSPSSLKDFYYIARRDIDERQRREWIQLFMDAFMISVFDRSTCSAALASDEPDFEDGIVQAMAEYEGCGCIISGDERAFRGSSVPAMSSEEYLRER